MNQQIDFQNLVIKIIEKLNNCGIECIKNNKKFCKYNSLMYFEQSIFYYEKYLPIIDEALFSSKTLNLLKKQKDISLNYIKNINSGAIILTEQSLKNDRTFDTELKTFKKKEQGLLLILIF